MAISINLAGLAGRRAGTMECAMIEPNDDLALMKMAFELSKDSRGEQDNRVHPFVGAVIVTPDGGHIIGRACRGQNTPGHHAEQEALSGQPADVARGAVVYTTLEPCIVRGTQAPCSWWLIKAGVSEVVIGMLDPNADIRGRGWWELESKGIRVRYFDPTISTQIRELNRNFIEYQLGVGLMITSIQPDGKAELQATPEHRDKRQVLEVHGGKLVVRGTYRVKPMRGDRIVVFVHRGNRYFPQQPINFDYDRDKRLWQAPSAWVRRAGDVTDNELVIARVSDDLGVAIDHYNTAHADYLQNHKVNDWFGIVMNTEPPGFERLAQLWVRVTR
jgi:pyrimidine deaminase RibD-like protein